MKGFFDSKQGKVIKWIFIIFVTWAIITAIIDIL